MHFACKHAVFTVDMSSLASSWCNSGWISGQAFQILKLSAVTYPGWMVNHDKLIMIKTVASPRLFPEYGKYVLSINVIVA